MRERTGPFGWCGTCKGGHCARPAPEEGGPEGGPEGDPEDDGPDGGDRPGVDSDWGFCEEHCLLDEEREAHADHLNEIDDLTMLSPDRYM